MMCLFIMSVALFTAFLSVEQGNVLKANTVNLWGIISVNHIVQKTSVINSESRDLGRRSHVSLKRSQIKALR